MTGDAFQRLHDPEDLVWAAIRRMGLPEDRDYDVAPTRYGGLFVDVWIAGGPSRSFELDEDRLQAAIDAGDRAAVDAAVAGIIARVEHAVAAVLDPEHRTETTTTKRDQL